jgi:Tfp pilus assembly protein PilV
MWRGQSVGLLATAFVQLRNINATQEPSKHVNIAIFETRQLHLSNSYQDNGEKSVR